MDIKRSGEQTCRRLGVDSFDAALGKPFEPRSKQSELRRPPRVSGDVEDRQRALLVKQTRTRQGVLFPEPRREWDPIGFTRSAREILAALEVARAGPASRFQFASTHWP